MKAFIVMILLVSQACFANTKKFGAGIVLFGPSGISGHYVLPSGNSIDAALAWNLGNGQTLYIHSNYLFKKADAFKIENVSFDFYYGIGGRIINKDSTQGNNAGTNVGVRVPVGVNYNWQSVPISAFAEIGATLNLTPGTSMDLAAALGGRYYF